MNKGNIPIPPIEISLTEIQRFAAEKRLRLTCIECASNQWEVSGNDNALSIGLPVQVPSQPFVLPTPQLPLVVMICMNCGSPRFFVKQVILDWSSAREAGRG
jgi:hypothetical protein